MSRSELRAPGVRQLATFLAARIVPALASMCLTFLCIHSLSAEAYGTYSLTLLPAGVVAGLIGGLSAQAMLRYGHELAPAELRRGLLGFPLAASAIAMPLIGAYLVWSVGLQAGVLFALVAIPLVALMDTRRSLFVARGRARSVLSMDVLRAVAALALAWVLFQAWGAHAAVPLLAQALSVALCLWVVRPQSPEAAVAGTRKVDRHYLSYGLWFAGWLAVVGVISVAERSVVEAVSGIAASGRYAAQADVVNAVFAATGGALASAMMPNYLAMSRDEDRNTLNRLLRLGLAGTLATGLLCVLFGGALSVLGSGQIAAALTSDPHTALTLVAAGIVWTAAGFVQKPLELRGQTRLTFAAAALSLLFFVVVAQWLAQGFGPTGVAIAKLAAGVFFVLVVWFAARCKPA